MKFKVEKEKMSGALGQVLAVINAKNPLQLLQNVYIEAKEGKLRFRATDMDMTLCTAVDAEVEEEGVTTLPAKRLSGVFREMAGDTATVAVDGENKAVIKAGAATFRLNGLASEEYPALPELGDEVVELMVEQASLREMLRRVSYAAMQDASRPLLSSVLLAYEQGTLAAVATDSRRLALVEQPLDNGPASPASLVVPLKAVAELIRTLGDEGTVAIKASARQADFSYGEITLVTKLMEGKYPNFRQVVPNRTNAVRVTVGREDFLAALRRTSQLVIDRVSGVNLNLSSNRLEVVAQEAEIGEGRDVIDATYEGEDLSISFNPDFLMDALRVLTEDQIYLELVDEMSPGVMGCASSFKYVIMPIRLQ